MFGSRFAPWHPGQCPALGVRAMYLTNALNTKEQPAAEKVMTKQQIKLGGLLLLVSSVLIPVPSTACQASAGSLSSAQGSDRLDELAALPSSLSPERLDLLQSIASGPQNSQPAQRRLRRMFFQSLYEHPRTARQVAIRDSVLRLADRRHQYVRVRLSNRTVLTGTIYGANRQGFMLQTDIAHTRRVTYTELAEPVQPVAGVGTRMVRGLETTGLVVALVILIPITIPLVMTGIVRE